MGGIATAELDGVGGRCTFGFPAVGAEEATLQPAYLSSREEPSPDARRFAVAVDVR